MITKEKNWSWGKICSTVGNYFGGKRSTEAWKILKNFSRNGNGRQCFNPIHTDNWEIYFKGLLTENIKHYLVEQETDLEGTNETEMDKIKLDI